MKRVVVVGGGVIGVACAHYLNEAGAAVTLVDSGAIGGGCSHANCGYVSPSHVLPLAAPGAIGNTLRALLRGDSAVSVRPRLDPALWSWLWRFARLCNRADMLSAGSAIAALLDSSRSLYAGLFAASLLEAEWEEKGLLFVFRTHKAMEHYAATDRLLGETFAMPATRYDGPALQELEPALLPGLAGGWHYPKDAHLRPDRLMDSWRGLLQNRGVELREQCPFTGFDRSGRIVRAVHAGGMTIPADAVVIATGAWTPLLHQHLGIRLPIQPGKGYSITMARPTRCPRIPILLEEDHVAVTPFASGYRLGSTMQFVGYDATLDPRRLEILRRAARLYLVEPEASPVQEEWWGWRPMVPDGKPIIGPTRGLDNVILAAGHSMLGLSMAPATGRLVAEILTGQTLHVDPAPYAATRF